MYSFLFRISDARVHLSFSYKFIRGHVCEHLRLNQSGDIIPSVEDFESKSFHFFENIDRCSCPYVRGGGDDFLGVR